MTLVRWLRIYCLYSLILFSSGAGSAGIGTTVPISLELASAMSGSLFPIALDLEASHVFLTRPQLVFVDEKRIGMATRFQIYDHRPELNIALSETGQVYVTGELDYDIENRLIILHQPRLEKLEFDRQNKASIRFTRELKSAWTMLVTDPMQSEIPPHPYLSPFKDYLQNISYDGKSIYLQLNTDPTP